MPISAKLANSELSDLSSGRSRGGAREPLILGKKEEIREGREAGRANRTRPSPPLAKGLDPPLKSKFLLGKKELNDSQGNLSQVDFRHGSDLKLTSEG